MRGPSSRPAPLERAPYGAWRRCGAVASGLVVGAALALAMVMMLGMFTIFTAAGFTALRELFAALWGLL